MSFAEKLCIKYHLERDIVMTNVKNQHRISGTMSKRNSVPFKQENTCNCEECIGSQYVENRLYIMSTVVKNVYKIGLSKHPKVRLHEINGERSSLQIVDPKHIRVTQVILSIKTKGNYEHERDVHTRFNEYRLYPKGEWFYFSPNTLKRVKAYMKKHTNTLSVEYEQEPSSEITEAIFIQNYREHPMNYYLKPKMSFWQKIKRALLRA